VKKKQCLRDAGAKVQRATTLGRISQEFLFNVWERQMADGDIFYDNRILNADTPSRFEQKTSCVTAMHAAVQEKKKI